MYKYTVTYEDYNGEAHEKEIYFNLSVPEMMRLETEIPGGYGAYLRRIAQENDPTELYKAFEKLVELSYGEKSEDGMRFVKKLPDGTRLFDRFSETPAYEQFIMDILQDETLASAFASGIVPSKHMSSLNAQNNRLPE